MMSDESLRKRAETLRGFDQLPNTALISIATAARLRDVSESTEWLSARNDSDYPPLVKFGARCTRVQVGGYRRYLAAKTTKKDEA